MFLPGLIVLVVDQVLLLPDQIEVLPGQAVFALFAELPDCRDTPTKKGRRLKHGISDRKSGTTGLLFVYLTMS